MANTQAPFGFRPIQSDSGESRIGYYVLASTSARVYEGDVVELSGGKVIKSTGTTAVVALGVAARASGALTGEISRFPVYNDPKQLYACQAKSAATQTQVGIRAALVQSTSSNYEGFSNQSVDAASTSTSWPVLILGLVSRPNNESGNYTELIVQLKDGPRDE